MRHNMKKTLFSLNVCVIVVALLSTACSTKTSFISVMSESKIIDLTQTLNNQTPIWPGDPEFKITPWATYEKDHYFINKISIGEHSGTHWGTPNTFIKGARSADMFKAHELVVPAVVIDIRDMAQNNKDYRLSIDDIKKWENRNGEMIPQGSVVILFTGWQSKWNDPESFLGLDDNNVLHWPGFDSKTTEFLLKERKIVGLGTDTHGADPGNDQNFGSSFAIYENDGMILECLSGLELLPPTGSILVIGGLPIKGGSGSPVRVIAFAKKK